ncbi:LamG-like jellyroll fold domain-containing protein [Flavobacterium piscis]|uniref:LamG-like jellyroll fold domain-containing protein n=1 Tax=Flavobacterium piscis TaxID=1114874 RepID=A0ABU1YDH8_9FLAO|nr:LamG-like jellyroll fold domain-containing protein [Flavobacterium piscis]MDR7212295.1 hypothetical protein [Flavobacterium piscis]
MKKILLFTLLLANFFYANALTRITAYRWRNDDGSEITATWKATTNAPIQINNFDPIRIRIAVEDNTGTDPNTDQIFGSSVGVNAILQFSDNNGQTWNNITDSQSPFTLVSSSVVNDGTNTTQQISSGNSSSFVAGLFKSTEQNTTFTMPRKNSSFTEHEFSIIPNSLISTSVTYTFVIKDVSTNLVIPTLTYCPTTEPTVTSPQNFNSSAKVSDLSATGTDLKWYTNATGDTALDATTALSTGLYYVSQTLSCESTRTQVQVNIIKGSALNFAGGYVDLPFNMPATYTKEAWINVSDLSKVNNIISGGNQDGRHAIYIPNGTLSAGHNGTYQALSDIDPLDADTWYHVAVTYDLATTTMTLYKNGNIVATDNNIPAFTGNEVRIGAFDTNNNLLYGVIDEARIWDKVLTQAEIQDQMDCEFAGAQPGLVGYYKFNQGFEGADNSAVTTLTDSSGNGNDGTLINFDLSASSSNWIGSSIIITGKTCTTLSVGDHNLDFSSSLKVYPNPSNNAFFINSDLNGTAVIFDLLGKVIQTQKINSGTTILDLGSTPNGVYLLKVTNEKSQSKTVKLIKN